MVPSAVGLEAECENSKGLQSRKFESGRDLYPEETVGSSCVQSWKAPSLIQMSVYKVCRVSWGIYVLWWIYVQAHCPKEYS